MRQKNECIFVEGQMDLIMSHQVGMINTVAVSGTALTEDHLRLVKRLADNIVLANDYDLAGLKASLRAVNLIRREGINVKVTKLPSGKDPAEVIEQVGSIGWAKIITEAKHYIDFMIDVLQEEGKTGLDLNLAVNNYVLPYVKDLDKKMEQAHFVAKLASLLGISEGAIWNDLEKIRTDEASPVIVSPKQEKADLVVTSRSKLIEDKILGLYFLLIDKEGRENRTKKLKELWGEEIAETKITAGEKDRERLALTAELWYDPKSNLVAEFEELAVNWQEERLRAELREAFTEVQLAERNKEEDKLNTGLRRCQELSIAINNLRK
jgi:DNA primase